MMKLRLFLCLLLVSIIAAAQTPQTVKNVIIMIPDGTSIGVYSAARWYKYYNKMGESLNIDPFISGTVTSHSSNAPIGDSAPTSSAYATGVLSQTGNVAIHPVATENDIYPVDTTRTYQPAATILEAMKIEKGKATGLVVTCEFPHATPADFSSHYYNRGNYKAIAPQIAYQNLDVLFGGGTSIVTEDMENHFKNNGTTYLQNDKNGMLNYDKNGKIWALFGEKALPYDLDRNPEKVPSIAEMTSKAIEILSKDEDGFFLMVEGSQVDWAAHANDPAAIITEFLAFDEAVGKVMEFAKKNGETAVIIASDHGNSGFTIGTSKCSGYDKLSIDQLFGNVSQYKLSANGIESMLLKTKPENIKSEFKKYTGIDLTDEELQQLLSSSNYKEGDYTKVGTTQNMVHTIVSILNSRTCFGYTTGGHTGEELILSSYHPQGDVLKGHVRNVDLNKYLFNVGGLQKPLQQLSDELFAKHSEVFNGMKYSIDKQNPDFPVLIVKKGKKTLEVKAFSSVAKLNGKPFDLGSVVVYIDKNNTFYLPANLADRL
ncbi:MAG: alkaline phosphatase [Dysgonamonadaceae bacterium]|jgi:alkaline phosphatase|nr:alkaline phosphatase [Dysgonamonadaceae bacterium]MDD3309100.1 alkaline phosphatase [Dysgonamonadaceae bacterium]MDD3900871.1 alkaline phosphatase [Dysgonamonadaceae bacterium]MDD4398518.1 alkaline phosphatase [Dysgonamonadaceae bacterium]MEA5081237.1 alkaline phosphatase [Dysgonamonadaceae bacterium]